MIYTSGTSASLGQARTTTELPQVSTYPFSRNAFRTKVECSLIEDFFLFLRAERDMGNSTMAVQDEIRGDERDFGVNL